MFGSKKVERAFRANWCQQFPWLHYNIDQDAAFCHVCMQADNEGKFFEQLYNLAGLKGMRSEEMFNLFFEFKQSY